MNENLEKGNEFLIKQDFKSAIVSFTKAINENPDKPEAYMRRAIAYAELQKKDESVADLKKASDLGYAEARAALKAYYNIDY